MLAEVRHGFSLFFIFPYSIYDFLSRQGNRLFFHQFFFYTHRVLKAGGICDMVCYDGSLLLFFTAVHTWQSEKTFFNKKGNNAALNVPMDDVCLRHHALPARTVSFFSRHTRTQRSLLHPGALFLPSATGIKIIHAFSRKRTPVPAAFACHGGVLYLLFYPFRHYQYGDGNLFCAVLLCSGTALYSSFFRIKFNTLTPAGCSPAGPGRLYMIPPEPEQALCFPQAPHSEA